MKVTIRKALPEDAEAVLNYIRQVAGETDFLTFGPNGFSKTVEEEATYIEAINTKTNCLMLLAEKDSQIVGMLGFNASPKEYVRHFGEFGITVRKAHWRNGIGRELINRLILWAKETGSIRKINLQVREDNTHARKLYESLGFIYEGRISRGLYVKAAFYDTIIMGLEI